LKQEDAIATGRRPRLGDEGKNLVLEVEISMMPTKAPKCFMYVHVDICESNMSGGFPIIKNLGIAFFMPDTG